MSEELGSQLRTKSDAKIKSAVPQQLDTLLAAVLESEIQSLPDTAQTGWTALLRRKAAQMVEKVAPTIINPLLLDLHVYIEKKLFGQV